MHKHIEQIIHFAKRCAHAGLIYLGMIWNASVKIYGQIVNTVKKYWPIFLHLTMQIWRVFVELCRRIAGWIKQNSITCSKTLWRSFIKFCRWIAIQINRFVQYCLIYNKIFWRACVYLFWWITGLAIRIAQSCLIISKLFWSTLVKFYIWIAIQIKRLALGCLAFSKILWHAFIKFCGWAVVQIKRFALGCLAFSKASWRIFVNLCLWIISQIIRFAQICLEIIQLLWRTFLKICMWIAVQVKRFAQGCLAFSKILWHTIVKLCEWITRQVIRFVQSCLIFIKTVWYAFSNLCLWIFRQVKDFVEGCLETIRSAWPPVKDRLYQYIQLTRLNKPIGIFLLLWPTLWALWIAAEGVPDLQILYVFISGVILMRSAGCVINDLADRNLDAHVARTQDRPIASGKVMPLEAIVIAAILIFSSFILVLNLNPLTLRLSVIAVVLAIIYPFMKRYTYLPQFFLGLAFGWAVPMAFAAETGSLPLIAWLLLFATVLWAVVYDTMYAMVDREDDIKAGIKSTAILFEDADRAIIGVIQLLVLLALILVGNRSGLGQFYFAGIAIAAVLSIYQQYLIKDRIPEHCFAAFLNSNWFGAIVFTGVFLHYHFN